MQLEELKVVVTGAASGMGRYFAQQFAQAGAEVAAVDLNLEGLDELVSEGGGKITALRCDVSKEDEVIDMIASAHEAMEGLNALINNAGIFRDGLLVKKDKTTGEVRRMTLSQWQTVIDVDLTGPFLCTREFSAKLIDTDTRPGVIVNMSSVARHGNRGQSNYSAAKAGLVADTKLWGVELAAYGIRVGAIAPGFVDTPILRAMRPEVLDGLIKTVPLRRVAQPHEMWLGVRFIVECDYFTGRCLDIDGGVTI